MSNWPLFYEFLFWLAVGSVLAAAIALPFVWRRGNKQIDQALAQVLDFHDAEQARSNVKRLRAHEVHAAVLRAKQRGNSK